MHVIAADSRLNIVDDYLWLDPTDLRRLHGERSSKSAVKNATCAVRKSD